MALSITAGLTNNASTLIEAQDYGVKIAKANYDVLTAPEQELLFNSSWPSLPIAKVKEYTLNGYAPSDAVTHEMPFVPLVMGFVSDGTGFYGGNLFYVLSADETNVYPGSVAPTPSSGTMKIVIYNIDITTDVEYPFKQRGGQAVGYDADYGMKLAKEGMDINSTDLRDYIAHSRCQSPLILAVKTQDTIPTQNIDTGAGTRTIQYSTGLNFVSYVFGFIRFTTGLSSGRYVYAPYVAQAYPATYTDGFTSQLQIIDSLADKGSIVVLRSPMFSETNEYTVTY